MGAPNGGLQDVVSNMLAQAQPRSGAVGLPQQQAQQSQVPQPQQPGYGLLPPPAGGNAQSDPMGMMGNGPLIDLPPLPGMGGAPEVLPVSGGPSAMQQGLQHASGQHNMSDRPTTEQMMGAPGPQGGGPEWANMLNLTGTGTNPNAFTRMGVGYNSGGLMGALGYLLTDLSQKNNQPQNQGGGY